MTSGRLPRVVGLLGLMLLVSAIGCVVVVGCWQVQQFQRATAASLARIEDYQNRVLHYYQLQLKLDVYLHKRLLGEDDDFAAHLQNLTIAGQ